MVFACKTATFGAELKVSVGPRPHLSFCACKTAWWDLGSIGPSPHLCFLHAKQRLLEQNYKSLWVPALICGSCMQNSEFWTRITILYGSQTSPFVLYMQKQRDFHQNDKCIWVPALICGFSMQNSEFWTGIKSIWVTDVTCRSVHQTRVICTRMTSLYTSSHAKQRL